MEGDLLATDGKELDYLKVSIEIIIIVIQRIS